MALTSLIIGLNSTFASASDITETFTNPNISGYTQLGKGIPTSRTISGANSWVSGNTAIATVVANGADKSTATITGLKAGPVVISLGTKSG
jgi:hypothetical protein